LKLCGPAILAQSKFAETTTSILAAIITKTHPCQQDLGDDEEAQDEEEESSEYDWLVIDTALDVVIGLATALGGQFGELWKVFQKPIMKYASSQTTYERSTAVGVIAECTSSMGDAITPYTEVLFKLLMKRLSDEDPETKSNAAYAIGQLIYNSTASNVYLPHYEDILSKLEPLLRTQRARTLDNACGCVTRMIMAHADHVPLDEILPVLVSLLPLKEDFEENEPIFKCITTMCKSTFENLRSQTLTSSDLQEHPIIIGLTPKLLPVFNSVLGDPLEQLDLETRQKLIQTVKFIQSKNASLLNGHEVLQSCV
jgi:hypothetical protein